MKPQSLRGARRGAPGSSGGLDLLQIKTQAQKSASEYCVEHATKNLARGCSKNQFQSTSTATITKIPAR